MHSMRYSERNLIKLFLTSLLIVFYLLSFMITYVNSEVRNLFCKILLRVQGTFDITKYFFLNSTFYNKLYFKVENSIYQFTYHYKNA